MLIITRSSETKQITHLEQFKLSQVFCLDPVACVIIRSNETKQITQATGAKQNTWDNLNCSRCETNMHFRNKKSGHLKYKTNELAMNRKNNITELY
jgi:hypothetical protein